MWSVFKATNKNKKRGWYDEYSFYHLDPSTIDIKTNWRTCEVKDRRKELVLMGTIDVPFEDLKFPIEYPLEMDGGVMLEKIEEYKEESD